MTSSINKLLYLFSESVNLASISWEINSFCAAVKALYAVLAVLITSSSLTVILSNAGMELIRAITSSANKLLYLPSESVSLASASAETSSFCAAVRAFYAVLAALIASSSS